MFSGGGTGLGGLPSLDALGNNSEDDPGGPSFGLPSLSDLAKADQGTIPNGLGGLGLLSGQPQSFNTSFLKDVDMAKGGGNGISLSALAAEASSDGLSGGLGSFQPPPLFSSGSSNPSSAMKVGQSTNRTDVTNINSTVDNSDLHETIDLTAALRLDKKDRLRPVTNVTQCSDHKEDHSASPGGASSALSKLSREVELLIPKIPPSVLSKPSPFGRVLCKSWKPKRRKQLANAMKKCHKITRPEAITNLPAQIKVFKFDQPSPDDVVRSAQSKVFKRPT